MNLSNVFDAAVWADEWLKVIEQRPGIPTDKGAMIGWFANAIMAGYDRANNEKSFTPGEDRLAEIERRLSEIETAHTHKIPFGDGEWETTAQVPSPILPEQSGDEWNRIPTEIVWGKWLSGDTDVKYVVAKTAFENLRPGDLWQPIDPNNPDVPPSAPNGDGK